MALQETTIQLSDLEDALQVLLACFNYFSARDLEQAQLEFRNTRPSPLTEEVQRVRTQLTHVLGDHLLAERMAEMEEDDLGDQEVVEGAEESAQSVSEASEEPEVEELASLPLGEPAKKPRGRRLKPEEV